MEPSRINVLLSGGDNHYWLRSYSPGNRLGENSMRHLCYIWYPTVFRKLEKYILTWSSQIISRSDFFNQKEWRFKQSEIKSTIFYYIYSQDINSVKNGLCQTYV